MYPRINRALGTNRFEDRTNPYLVDESFKIKTDLGRGKERKLLKVLRKGSKEYGWTLLELDLLLNMYHCSME